jgi:hypothetical protein
MNRSLKLGLAFAACAAALAAGVVAWPEGTAPLPSQWEHWLFSRAITIEQNGSPAYVNATVPFEVFGRAGDRLEDLRVIDDRGREVPYVLYTRYGQLKVEPRDAQMGEKSSAHGKFTQVVLDAGEKAPFHNAIQVNTTRDDFIAWCEVAVSDDARAWRIVNDRSPIFRFRKNAQDGVQRLRYSGTNARYIRLRVFDAAEQFPVDTVTVLYDVTEPPEEVPAPVTLTPQPAHSSNDSEWIANFGPSPFPVNEVRFEVEQKDFVRRVGVMRRDEEQWIQAGSGDIYRFSENGVEREWLRVSVNEETAREWLVRIYNGDDAPLNGARPVFYATPRHVIFRTEPGRTYRLLYGESEAKAPSYDLARWANAKGYGNAPAASLGPEETNPNYTDPRPWTEQHTAVLWSALGLAVVLLGYSALRALQRSSAGS